MRRRDINGVIASILIGILLGVIAVVLLTPTLDIW